LFMSKTTVLLLVLACLMPAVAWNKTPNPAGEERLAVGIRLPDLAGEFLTGRKVVLPSAATGKVVLIALGFSYNSRFQVEAWTARFRTACGSLPGITFFEVPMLGGAARMARWFIDSGMRKGTPKELHENVITVYGGTGPWKNRIGFQGEDDAYLILLDREGKVRWLHSGSLVEGAFKELSDLTRQLAETP
jgi:hypothetical protein